MLLNIHKYDNMICKHIFASGRRMREIPFTELCKGTGFPGRRVSAEPVKIPHEVKILIANFDFNASS